MSRRNKILKYIDKNGCGVEIGPSHNPLASKKDGFNVDIIDHASREELIEKYQNHGVDLDSIEDVDFVWSGQSYKELTGKDKHYDWVIASHVIEHTPDLITFLNDCAAILKDDGVLSLVIPDKRYCFDHFRPITGIARIIDSYTHKNTIHSAGEVAEYYLNVVAKSGVIAWDSSVFGKYELVHSLKDAIQRMDSVNNEQVYIDVHGWCFVPHSFRLIIHDLYSLGLIPFKEVDFHPTVGHEFYMTLSKNGKGLSIPRIDVLNTIEIEVKDNLNVKNIFILKLIKILKKLKAKFSSFYNRFI